MGSIVELRRTLSKERLVTVACLLLAAWSLPAIWGQDDDGAAAAAARADALRILNDSAWAHTVTPTTEDTACDWEHPAFPGIVPEDVGAMRDAENPNRPRTEAVKPDTAEYLIRWMSVKPVQAAIDEMMALDAGWRSTTAQLRASDDDAPTDVALLHYNPRDMISIAVILKHPGADGSSFIDYAFRDEGSFPTDHMEVWPCAGLKTRSGQVYAHALGPGTEGRPTYAILLLFPRLVDGKPLITGPNEKVQFRLIARQRVFETTFTINARDVLDGSEPVAYFSTAVR